MYDIEKIIAGSDEVNRKGNVIKRVLSNLALLMQRSEQRWEEGAVLFGVPVYEDVLLSFVAGKYRFGPGNDILVKFGKFNERRFVGGFDFHHLDIPAVYRALPALLEAADAAVPEAKVKGFCDFFAGQAPNS